MAPKGQVLWLAQWSVNTWDLYKISHATTRCHTFYPCNHSLHLPQHRKWCFLINFNLHAFFRVIWVSQAFVWCKFFTWHPTSTTQSRDSSSKTVFDSFKLHKHKVRLICSPSMSNSSHIAPLERTRHSLSPRQAPQSKTKPHSNNHRRIIYVYWFEDSLLLLLEIAWVESFYLISQTYQKESVNE
jgi:hypothetical protein